MSKPNIKPIPAWRRISPTGPYTKTWDNESDYEVDDLIRLVRGVFSAERLTQKAGWVLHVKKTRSDNNPVTVQVCKVRCGAWTTRARIQGATHSGGSKPVRYGICIGLPTSDKHLDGDSLAPALINQLVGQLMVEMNSVYEKGTPWWVMNTLWADGLLLRKKPGKPKLTTDERVLAREAHARKMLERAEADADRALARVEKWQRKVTYYDKKNDDS